MPQTNYVDGNLVRNITSAGETTSPLQPAFFACANSQSNVTGDGTVYTMIWANEIFDQNNDFDGTSTFTAPVTGKYQFNVFISAAVGATVPTSLNIILVTTKGSYYITKTTQKDMIDSGNGPGTANSWGNSLFCDMDATDTAYVTIQIGGSAKSSDMASDSYFSGFLVC